MKLLRDKSLSTQILILYELYTNNYSKLSPIAEKIGVTQQAISEYTKKMKKQGLIQKVDNEYKPTMKGTQLLQTELTNLKKFVDGKIEKIPVVNNCFALAKTPIKKGEEVGLFMENGWLVANANKKSPSIGIATTYAEIDDYIIIKNLQGIIDHDIGKIYFFELKTNQENNKKIKQKIQGINIDKIGILDIPSKSICSKIGIKPDFEFSTTNAAIDAAIRGLNTLVLGENKKLKESFKLFEEINEKSNTKIKFERFSL